MSLRFNALIVLMSLCVLNLRTVSYADSSSIQLDMNHYFARMDTSLIKLTKSSVFTGTKLSPAENLLFRALKKNIAIYSFTRVNSKGKIVSLAVRSKDIERPDSSVEKEKWFQDIKKNMEDYYTVTKDNDRGRYYLIWIKPLSKKGTFTGAVVAKIDLWDSFYEFSNGVYYPFLIRLNGLSLFSHKWENTYTFRENRLTIPGINKISVKFIPEKESVATENKDSSASVTQVKADSLKTGGNDTLIKKTVSSADTAKIVKSVNETGKKKNGTLLVVLIVIFIICVSVIAAVIISRRRKAAFLRQLDEE